MKPGDISIQDFTYQLPESIIAKYPLAERDSSKLLIYKDGEIIENIFAHVCNYLPENSLLVFNNTKVIHARLLFKNKHGTMVEIFCLEPAEGAQEISLAMAQKAYAKWNCMIGRADKWKEKLLEFTNSELHLTAEIVARTADAFVIEFKWSPAALSFAEVLEKSGNMPIPPYLRRKAEAIDDERYQTVYAKFEGSVAAPTAGLHFTPKVFENLQTRHIQNCFLTLHVGAGTFKPVKAEKIREHEMHAETIEVTLGVIEQLIAALAPSNAKGNKIVAVGTTSLRTLESLYWLGLKVNSSPEITDTSADVQQWEPYEENVRELTAHEALSSLIAWMKKNGSEKLIAKTAIMIVPGYRFKIIDALVTNFHQPGSTLLLLVAALVGNDWKKIYNYALEHEFRFLSYGDSSLLFRNEIDG
jgi:S-adenosylmethionine:tRNA ribosyltransferase-isomerase